jgi:polyhydroxyalkanoate synthesis regulator phasin
VRKKLIIATTAGVLTLGGVAVAVPVLADTDPVTAAERIREALTGLVDDGSITDEQADEVAATLGEAGLGDRHGHGDRHGPGRPLALHTAADALGLTEGELREALQADGTSLADVAEAQDVDVDTLVRALVDGQEERIAEAVEDGRLTQEEADERLADLEERVTDLVNSDDLPRGGPGWGRHGDHD